MFHNYRASAINICTWDVHVYHVHMHILNWVRDFMSWCVHMYMKSRTQLKICICTCTYAHMNARGYVQPIPPGVTFSNAVRKLKAQISNVSFHWNVAKETFELLALSFRKCHPKWDWLYMEWPTQLKTYICTYDELNKKYACAHTHMYICCIPCTYMYFVLSSSFHVHILELSFYFVTHAYISRSSWLHKICTFSLSFVISCTYAEALPLFCDWYI